MADLPSQLNIRDKPYNFSDCNLYQQMIYRLMAQKVDQLKVLQQTKQQAKFPAEKTRINTDIVKGVGVLDFFQERFEAFHGIEDVTDENMPNLSLYGG